MFEYVGPVADNIGFYGASTELASRFVPQSMLEDPQSTQTIAEAVWEGLQIATDPLQDHIAGVLGIKAYVILLGDVAAATKDRVNETGANPGFYDAAWLVIYSVYVFLFCRLGFSMVYWLQVVDPWNEREHVCVDGAGCIQGGGASNRPWADGQLSKRGQCLGDQLAGE